MRATCPALPLLDDVARALEARGYQNTGELEGHGTFCVRGGAIDVYPGNLVYPVRLDFFGDELDEIRRIVPSTGQTIATLGAVEIYPAQEFQLDAVGIARVRKKLARPAESNPALREVLEKLEGGARFDGADVLLPYLYDEVASLPAYADPAVRAEDASADFPEPACARPAGGRHKPRARRTRRRPLIATSSPSLVEPRSLFDDAVRSYDDICRAGEGHEHRARGAVHARGAAGLRRGAAHDVRLSHAPGRDGGRRAAGQARRGGWRP